MLTILLVDDDLDELDLFKSALKDLEEDINLLYVSSCSDVVDMIENAGPDLLFLDINMPGLNGIECLKSIREEEKFKSLPIVMYSTSSNKKVIKECYDHKANFYFIKPYSFDGIL